MPLYTYKCPDCGESFEDLVKMADRDDPQPCKCGGKAIRTYNDVPANMSIDWGAWNNQAAKLQKLQKKHRGSVPDSVKERHSGVKPKDKRKMRP